MSDRQNPESSFKQIGVLNDLNQEDVYLFDLDQDTNIVLRASRIPVTGVEAQLQINFALDQNNNGQLDDNEIFFSTTDVGEFSVGNIVGNMEDFVVENSEVFNQLVSSGTYFVETKLLNPFEATTGYYVEIFLNSEVQNDNQLQFDLNKTTYSADDTLSLTEAWVRDNNGSADIAKVDFWLFRPDGEWQDLQDVTEFELWSEDNDWASFEYSVDLTGYPAGEYLVWAQAEDISGVLSNEVRIPFTIESQANTANSAPINLQFGLNQTILADGDTLSLTDAWIQDLNGSDDLQRIELWLQTPNGTWEELAQITDFQAWNQDNTWAIFNYGIEIDDNFQSGSYLVWAKAYDLSNAVSNEVSVNFEITSDNLT